MTKPNPDVEHFSPATAAALDRHEINIRAFLAGQRVGAAQQFGYAYLAGRELLQAKDALPHGNAGDRSLGLKRWVQSHFPKWSYRTATNWMEFARCINDHKEAVALFKKRPLLLRKNKLTVKDRATILEAVPLVMDGKGMLRFMRETRLLADPQKQKHHPRKPVDPDKAAAAQAKLSERHWASLVTDLTLGQARIKDLDPATTSRAAVACLSATNQLIKRLEVRSQQEFLDLFIESGNAIRGRLKSQTRPIISQRVNA